MIGLTLKLKPKIQNPLSSMTLIYTKFKGDSNFYNKNSFPLQIYKYVINKTFTQICA